MAQGPIATALAMLVAAIIAWLPGGSARAALPNVGEILVLDQTANNGPTLFAVTMNDQVGNTLSHVVTDQRFGDLVAIAWGPQKRIYVASRSELSPQVALYDPYAMGGGTIVETYGTPHLKAIADLVADGQGGLYVLDAKADPLDEQYIGAIFHLDPQTGAFELVISAPHFTSPKRMVREAAGTLLVLDPNGRLTPGGPPQGALYRVDPQTHTIQALRALDTITLRPEAIEQVDEGTLLLLDSNLIVPGMGGAGGGILKLSTQNWAVLDTLALAEFGDPSDLVVDVHGNLIVLDMRAQVPSGRALFRIDPRSGQMLGDAFENPNFAELRSMVCLGGPEVDQSVFRLQKVNGFPPVVPGDRIRLSATLRNTGVVPTGSFQLIAQAGALVPLLGTQTSSGGELSYDPSTDQLIWTGALAAGEQQQFTIDLRVPEYSETVGEMGTLYTAEGELVRMHQLRTITVVSTTTGGDLIVADPGSPGSPTLSTPRLFRRVNPTETQRVYWNPEILPYPVDLTFGADGFLYVLSGMVSIGGSTVPSRLVKLDPRQPSSAVILHEGPPLERVAGICLAHDGSLLIADPKSPAVAPGVIYRFDLATGLLSEFFRDEEMIDPVNVTTDTGGGYIVCDYRYSATGQMPGRIFVLDGQGHELRVPIGQQRIQDPMCATVMADNTIYIADERLNTSPDRGAIVKIARPLGPSGMNVFVTELIGPTNPLLVDPHGIEALDLDGDGDETDMLICDRNPVLAGGRRAVYQVIEEAGLYGGLTAWVLEDSLRNPRRVARRVLPKVEVVAFDLEEVGTVNGLIEPGDVLSATVVLQNPTHTPALGVTSFLSYPASLTLASYTYDENRGAMYDNTAARSLHWSGDLAFIDPVTIEARFTVNATVSHREIIRLTYEIRGLSRPVSEEVSVQAHAPLRGGELVVLDAQADPFGTGQKRGTLYLMDAAAATLYPYYPDVAAAAAADIYMQAAHELLVVDRTVQSYSGRGAVLKLNLLTGNRSAWVFSELFSGPSRIVRQPDGGFAILDHLAELGLAPARGAIFQVRADGSNFEVAAFSRAFRWLADMTFDDQGRLWVSDQDADPLGLGRDTGAIFLLSREGLSSQYTMVDTVAAPMLVRPQGLLWVRNRGLLFTDPGWRNAASETGVLLYNPVADSISVVATHHKLVTPRRLLPLSEREILIVDQYATWQSNEDGVIFKLDLGANPPVITRAASLFGTDALTSVVRVPTPQAALAFFGADEDVHGQWVERGDTLHCEIRIVNSAGTTEPAAELTVTASEHLFLEQAGAQASSGTLTLAADRLVWQGAVAGWDSVTIRYVARILSTPGLSALADQQAKLTRADGTFQRSRLLHQIATRLMSGDYVVVDRTIDPLGLGGSPGGVLRVEGATSSYSRQVVPLIATDQMVTPVDIALIPGSHTKMLIADANAPRGTLNRGGVFLADIQTGAYELVCQDPTFAEPRALVVVDSTLCYLLDEGADPFERVPGPHAPGAIYRIDLVHGTAEVVFSDSIIASPVGLVMIPSTGQLIMLNRQGGVSGDHAGRVVSIDPQSGAAQIIREGSPFREPRSIALDRDERLLIVDFATGEPAGMLYSVGLDGSYEALTRIDSPNLPTGMCVDHTGRILIADSHADPLGFGVSTGTIFQTERMAPAAGIFFTGPPLVDPRGIVEHYDVVPVTLSALALAETDAGVRLSWRAPSQLGDADFYIYRRAAQQVGTDWALLNPHDPVRGAGDRDYLDPTVCQGSFYEYLLVAALMSGGDLEFGPLAIEVRLPVNRFELERIRPNPVQVGSGGRGMTIRYRLPAQGGRVTLDLYDVSGRRVHRLVEGAQPGGAHVLLWNGRDAADAPVPSGVYFLRLASGVRVQDRRFVLVH